MRAARRAGTALAANATARTASVAAAMRPTPGVLTSNSNDSAIQPFHLAGFLAQSNESC